MRKQGSLHHMLCEICVSDRSANTYNLEETTKLFIILWTSRQQEYLSVRAFHRQYKYSPTHPNLVINSHTGMRHTILSSMISGLKNKLECKNWLLKKVLFIPNWNSFNDRHIVTKYPFPHDPIHLQVNSDQSTHGKGCLRWDQMGDQREKPVGVCCVSLNEKKLWFLVSQGE